jgi:CheY-like chemotaxis protein/nitrogen-specific signal transduction histidine kinase/HPt (histidine-containing phosphotransfer) domain-containing protein
MSLPRIHPVPRSGGTPGILLSLTAIAVVVAAAAVKAATSMSLPIAPMLLAVLLLTVGLLPAAVAALAVTIFELVHPAGGGLQASALAVSAVFGVELLRRGLTPVAVWALMALSALVTSPWKMPGGPPFATGPIAVALLDASTCVSLATMMMLLLPVRGRWAPWRCRTRWDHLTFAALVGPVCIAVLTLTGAGSDDAGGSSVPPPEPALRILLLVGGAVTIAAISAPLLARLFARWPAADAPRRAGRAARIRQASHLLPHDVTRMLLVSLRRWRNGERSVRRAQNLLGQLRGTITALRNELDHARAVQQQRTGELHAAMHESSYLRGERDALIQAWPGVVLQTDDKGVILRVSGTAAALLGYQPNELAGKPVDVLVPEESLLEHPLLRKGGAGPKATEGPVKTAIRTAQNARREQLVRVFEICVHGGNRRMVLLSAPADPGVKPPMPAEVVNPSHDIFIAAMSHEMRTPLHGLIATLDMMQAEGPNQDFRRQLAIARSSAKTLLKIANDVLDLSRIGSSLFTLERRAFSMSSILDEVVHEARARAASLGLTLETVMKSPLPPSFVGDPARIKQILGNLVSNAMKFTTRGGVTLEVCHDGSRCIIDVRDTGEGIAPEMRERIFEPFVQASSRQGARMGGTGLGLPISRRLAEAMGGTLVVYDTGPHGSTFRLSLPLEASDEAPPEDQSLRVFANPHGRILVVEDNPANQYVARALLTALECPVTIAASGEESLALVQKEKFDLILMDCQMPGIDGLEATRAIRRLLGPRVPIIAMTANAMAEDRKACLAAGMDDFLPKPFGRRALSEMLCKWLAPKAAVPAGVTSRESRPDLQPDVDTAVLNELWQSLQWRLEPLQRIRDTFVNSLETLVPLLRSADPATAPAIQRQLHTILGSAGMVGARQIEYLAGKLRMTIQEGRFEDLKKTALLFERAASRYDREFERWLEHGRAHAWASRASNADG